MKCKILFFCLVFVSALSFGQQKFNLIFNHLKRDNGLSNTNVLSMLQDRRGFVWMATMNGLNRFDGRNVKAYKPYNSNIQGSYVNKLIENKYGQMWLGTNKGLSYYDEIADSFVHFEGPIKGKDYGASPYYIDDKENVWVSITMSEHIDLYVFSPKSKSFKLVLKNVPKRLADINQKPNQALKSLFYTFGTGIIKNTIQDYKIIKEEHFLNDKLKLENVNPNFNIENDSTVWLTNSTHGLTRFNPLKNSHTSFLYFGDTKMFTLNQMVQYGSSLLISGNKGISVFDKQILKFTQIILQEPSNPYSISANYVEYLYLGTGANLFCSVFGNGIDYTNLIQHPAENIFTIETAKSNSLIDNAVFRMFKKGENILVKLQNGGTIEINKHGKILGKIDKSGQPIFIDSKERYWTTQNSEQNKILIYDKNLKLIKSIDPKPQFNWFSFYGQGVDLEKNKYLISNINGVYEYNELKNTWLDITANVKVGSPINTFYFEENRKEMYVSSNWWTKFHVFLQNSGFWSLKYSLNIGCNVYCIRPSFKANYLWLGTDKGLIHFNCNTLKYKVINERDGLPDNVVNDIIEEKNGDYWLVTDKGIAFYSQTKKSFKEINIVDGANVQNYNGNQNFKLTDSALVFSGNNGITKINNTQFSEKNSKTKIEITEISSNEKPLKTLLMVNEIPALELASDQNSFALSFVAIDYTQGQNLKLKYKLNGIDNDWVKTANPSTARYSKVNEGTYIFEIQVLDGSSTIVLNSKKIQIRVAAPFYRTTLFRILMAFLLMGAAYFFYKIRSQQIRNETKKIEEIKRIRAESEINALRSQMNPHFIFNCLNTVDSYILLNKTEEASNFLHKFSKLIRMILENSRQEFIPIKQDIEALELYIKLEKERSYPSFDYSLDIDPECLSSTFYIPATIVQPFVENAILHGLRHKNDGKGMLFLKYTVHEKVLQIDVADNGIGRKAADIINFEKSQHKTSLGMSLTQERIHKLNELYPQQASINIIDLEKEQIATGTAVKIHLPMITLENI